MRVITPGSTAGEPLHVLSSLERRSPRWDSDPEAARASLAAAVSLMTTALGLRPDVPAGTLRVAPLAPSPFGAINVTGLRLAGQDLAVQIDASGTVLHVTHASGLTLT